MRFEVYLSYIENNLLNVENNLLDYKLKNGIPAIVCFKMIDGLININYWEYPSIIKSSNFEEFNILYNGIDFNIDCSLFNLESVYESLSAILKLKNDGDSIYVEFDNVRSSLIFIKMLIDFERQRICNESNLMFKIAKFLRKDSIRKLSNEISEKLNTPETYLKNNLINSETLASACVGTDYIYGANTEYGNSINSERMSHTFKIINNKKVYLKAKCYIYNKSKDLQLESFRSFTQLRSVYNDSVYYIIGVSRSQVILDYSGGNRNAIVVGNIIDNLIFSKSIDKESFISEYNNIIKSKISEDLNRINKYIVMNSRDMDYFSDNLGVLEIGDNDIDFITHSIGNTMI